MRTAILLVAYGASNPESKAGARFFEGLCRERFGGFPIRWAFSSPIARRRMAEKMQKGDSVAKALRRLRLENFGAVALQPLQTLAGTEYEELLATTRVMSAETGLKCAVGNPLLPTRQKILPVAEALCRHIPGQTGMDDVVLVAHGARHPSGALYCELAQALASQNGRYHLCAMSSPPCLADVLPLLKSSRVWLMPLLSIIGLHALRDVAGDGEASWKSRIAAAGHICVPILKGMAQSPEISRIWLDNLSVALENL